MDWLLLELLRFLQGPSTFPVVINVILLTKPLALLFFRLQVPIHGDTHRVRTWRLIKGIILVRYNILKMLFLRILFCESLVPSIWIIRVRNCLEFLCFSEVRFLGFLRFHIV